MSDIVSPLDRLGAPLWRAIDTHPIALAAVLGAVSALLFYFHVPYLPVAFGLGAGLVLMTKAEMDLKRDKAVRKAKG